MRKSFAIPVPWLTRRHVRSGAGRVAGVPADPLRACGNRGEPVAAARRGVEGQRTSTVRSSGQRPRNLDHSGGGSTRITPRAHASPSGGMGKRLPPLLKRVTTARKANFSRGLMANLLIPAQTAVCQQSSAASCMQPAGSPWTYERSSTTASARSDSRSARSSSRCAYAASPVTTLTKNGQPIPAPRLPRSRLSGCMAAPPNRSIAK
jgi:hypothetical protein